MVVSSISVMIFALSINIKLSIFSVLFIGVFFWGGGFFEDIFLPDVNVFLFVIVIRKSFFFLFVSLSFYSIVIIYEMSVSFLISGKLALMYSSVSAPKQLNTLLMSSWLR